MAWPSNVTFPSRKSERLDCGVRPKNLETDGLRRSKSKSIPRTSGWRPRPAIRLQAVVVLPDPADAEVTAIRVQLFRRISRRSLVRRISNDAASVLALDAKMRDCCIRRGDGSTRAIDRQSADSASDSAACRDFARADSSV